MTESKPSRGIQGALVKLWRGGDYELTVTGRTEITPNYLRLHFTTGTLLAERPVHPTMWVRGWFPDGDKAHQRGYTLVNPDPAAATTDIDFALHDGLATRWAQEAKPGDLAFFDNAEGRITHVGILLNDHQILHASGVVRIDPIDNEGIMHAESGRRTHHLRLLKRYF